jgi:branched-subunit amino acid aminotransferase/4-amino-4-deoxychorismate lyase
MELAGRLGISSAQRNLTTDDVAAAEEVFLTSTPLCLLPVVRFNGRPIGAGRPGKIFGELLSAWSEMVGVDVARQAERFARNEEGCRARDAHVV